MMTFMLFLGMFIFIGISSARLSKVTTEDYLIASRDIHPFLGSLSAAATNTSGYMFIGLIGFTYKFGISSIWVTIGWISGDYFLWRIMYRRMREETERAGARTVSHFLGSSPEGVNRIVSAVAGAITLVFLSTYASAQLTAGGKALHVLFDWNYATGSVIGAMIILAYCFAGGIRASIWTDAAQATVMIISMSLLLVAAGLTVGGPLQLLDKLGEVDPSLVKLFPENLAFGIPLYVLGWVAAGIGVAGEPDMQIRIMAIRSVDEITTARRSYFGWYIPFSIAAVGVGLYSRLLLPEVSTFDPELALPALSMELLPEVFVGLMLAGLFAATMSTADSQVLSSGAALTQDIYPRLGDSRRKTKAGTIVIVAYALGVALFGGRDTSVFELVTIAWSGLGASLGPMMILRSFRKYPGTVTSVIMMLGGMTTVLLWRYVFEFTSHVYEILPGIVVSFSIYLLSLGIKKLVKKG